MPKGISLEQFREQIETDASRRCIAQEKTIKELNEQIKSLTSQIDEEADDIRALSNRCFALSHGLLCIFCGMRKRCPKFIV